LPQKSLSAFIEISFLRFLFFCVALLWDLLPLGLTQEILNLKISPTALGKSLPPLSGMDTA